MDLTFTPPDPSVFERWMLPLTDPNWGKGIHMKVEDFHLRGLVAGHYLISLATRDLIFGMQRRVDENTFQLIPRSIEVQPGAPRFNYGSKEPILGFSTLDEMNNRCIVFDFIRRSAKMARFLKDCDFGTPIGNNWLLPWPERSFTGGQGSLFTTGVLPGDVLTEEQKEFFSGVLPADLPQEIVTVYPVYRKPPGEDWQGTIAIVVAWDSGMKCTNFYAWDDVAYGSDQNLIDYFPTARAQIEQVWDKYNSISEERRHGYGKVFTYDQLDALVRDYKEHPFASEGEHLMSIFDFEACVRLLQIIEDHFPDAPNERSKIYDTVLQFGVHVKPHFEALAREDPYIRYRWDDLKTQLRDLRDVISAKRETAKNRSAALRAEADRHRSSSSAD